MIVGRGNKGSPLPSALLLSIKQSNVAVPTPTDNTGNVPGHPNSNAAPIESICTWLITILKRTPILNLFLPPIVCFKDTFTARTIPAPHITNKTISINTLIASPGHLAQSKSFDLKYPGAPILFIIIKYTAILNDKFGLNIC